jgi:hypothetical protein
MKATVLIVSGFSSSSSIEFWNIFMPLSTFLGDVSKFLHPTAMIASYYLTKFLLQERQPKPSSLTCKL